MEDILRVENLSKQFGGLKAVDQFSMNVQRNAIHALIGPNGAGKTTITNLICGEIQQDSGEILFQGESLGTLKVFERARKGIGRTYQNIRLFDTLTVLENMTVAAKVEHSYGMLRTIFSYKSSQMEKKERRDKAMDILKYIINPSGAFFFGFTFNAILAGVIYGAFWYKRPLSFARVMAARLVVIVVCNLLLNTLWLSMLSGKGFLVLLGPRVLKNLIMWPVDSLVFVMVAGALERSGVLKELRKAADFVR